MSLNNFRVPVAGEKVLYFERPGDQVLAKCRVAIVLAVEEPPHPAAVLELNVLQGGANRVVKEVPFGQNSPGCWGWAN